MSISEVGSATNNATSGTAVSVTHGLTINAGDIILAIIHANGSGNTITDNNGANSLTEALQESEVGGNTNNYLIAVRVAGASEPASYNWTLDSSDRWSVQVRVFSGVDTTSIWDVPPSVSTRNTGASDTATAPSMTTSTAGSMGILLILTDDDGRTISSPTNGYGTEVEPATPGQTQASYIRIWASAGSTGTSSATIDSSTGWIAHQFALKEASAGGGISIPVVMNHLTNQGIS